MKDSNLKDDSPIRHTRPPNWDQIVTQFPIVASAESNVVFTFFPYIHVPGGQNLPPDMFVHESIHLRQQEAYPGGPQTWWDEYCSNDKFRLKQELEAYGAQLALYNHAPNRYFEFVKDKLAQDMSSEFYGRIISFGEAASKIRRYARSLSHVPVEAPSDDSV